jgi:hypothetical protein
MFVVSVPSLGGYLVAEKGRMDVVVVSLSPVLVIIVVQIVIGIEIRPHIRIHDVATGTGGRVTVGRAISEKVETEQNIVIVAFLGRRNGNGNWR